MDDAEGERGCIINVASVAAQDGQNGQIAYSAGASVSCGWTLEMPRTMEVFFFERKWMNWNMMSILRLDVVYGCSLWM